MKGGRAMRCRAHQGEGKKGHQREEAKGRGGEELGRGEGGCESITSNKGITTSVPARKYFEHATDLL